MNISENCVRTDEVPGIDGGTIVCGVAYKPVRINRIDSAVASGSSTIELRLVYVDTFVIFRGRAWKHTGRARTAGHSVARRDLGWGERTVVGNVVEGADRARRTAGYQGHQTGERVRRLRGAGVEIIDARLRKLGEIRAIRL